MRNFYQYMFEGIFGFGKKPQPQNQSAPPAQSHNIPHEDEEEQYQAEMANFKKMVEDFAKDGRITRDVLIQVMTDKKYDGQPLYKLIHYILPDTDYMLKDSQSVRQHEQEVQLLVKHALQWFDAAHTAPPTKNFDWDHTKDLARRRATDRQRATDKTSGKKNILPGPWAGVKSAEPVPGDVPVKAPVRKTRKRL